MSIWLGLLGIRDSEPRLNSNNCRIMKKEVFETPAIEVAMLDDMEMISTGDCCYDGHPCD